MTTWLLQVGTTSPLTSAWWSGAAAPVLFTLLGALVSFYATVVFERYKRFGGLLREVAQARRYDMPLGYPVSPRDLERAHPAALSFWGFVERKQGEMNAEGHHDAAARLGLLVSFAHRSRSCIEEMLADKNNGNSIDAYFSFFQSEYGRIKNRDFIRFEESIHGKLRTFLRPFPQPVLPKESAHILVDYFEIDAANAASGVMTLEDWHKSAPDGTGYRRPPGR